MDELKRMVSGIGLIVLATYLAVFGGVWMRIWESWLAFGLWLGSPLVAVPGAYYFLTVPPDSDGSDAETKP
jgi:hypothetical protein